MDTTIGPTKPVLKALQLRQITGQPHRRQVKVPLKSFATAAKHLSNMDHKINQLTRQIQNLRALRQVAGLADLERRRQQLIAKKQALQPYYTFI